MSLTSIRTHELKSCRKSLARHQAPVSMSSLRKNARRQYDAFVVGAFRFPHGDASAQRLLTLAQAAAAGGYCPLVINDLPGNAGIYGGLGSVATVDGVDFICLPAPGGGRVRRLIHRVSRPVRIGRVISLHQAPSRRPIVTLASGLCSFLLLMSLRLVLRARVVADIVERHDAEQFPRGKFEPYFIRHRWTSTMCKHFANRVLVISSELAAVNANVHPAPLILPPMVDLADYLPPRPASSTTLNLLYVGTPRGKDQLGLIFDAIIALEPTERADIRLTIAGADSTALAANPDVGRERVEALSDVMTALGYLGRGEVLQLLSTADFTVLIRPTTGYAAAGFPSKVPESLAAGCPVITNISSDLGDYLVDGHNALICPPGHNSDEVSVETVLATIRRALRLSPSAKNTMSHAARGSADAFSARAWGPNLAEWLEEIP